MLLFIIMNGMNVTTIGDQGMGQYYCKVLQYLLLCITFICIFKISHGYL